jgi:Ca2+-binding RTX toxin-like protein
MTTRTIRLSGADDLFRGGARDETIYGMAGSDRIHGGGGDDRLFADDADTFGKWLDGTLTDKESWIDGGAGNDEIESDALCRSTAFGGDGHDSVVSRSQHDAFAHGGAGNDIIGVTGDFGRATAHGGDGDDIVTVWAPHGHARGFSGNGNDVLSMDRSRSGYLGGGAGDDMLIVSDATSTQVTDLDGGAGKDLLQGNAGTIERFVFRAEDTGVGRRADQVLFFGEEDTIDLSRIDANGDAAGNGRFRFAGSDRDPAPGEVGWHAAVVGGEKVAIVTFDDGSGDHEIVLRYAEDTRLAASDFLL